MRSLLFVPADGGSKLDKAFASGADAVIVDLEDSIAPDRKAPARASGAAFLRQASQQATRPRLLVRVNGLATGETDAVETVYVDFRNLDGLRRDTEEARRDGFTGRLAIHPAQVAVINEVFTPTAQALAKAQAVIAAFAAAPGAGVVAIDGVMYDRPHLVRAQALLARAQAAGTV